MMVSYGLDQESAQKVFKYEPTRSGNTLEQIEFTTYAWIGLRNFYNHHEKKFRDRVRKGPPPAYRWFAWYFLGSRILPRCKGQYENKLK